jgi:MerR family transcriptional regulator, copper efflux regulator
MSIGELAKKTGLSKDTIRFYTKLGLIESRDRQAGSRVYQDFSPEMVERLLMITQGKSLGFTLSEIKQLLDSSTDGTLSMAEKIKATAGKLAQIREKIQQLQSIEMQLSTKLDRLQQLARAESADLGSR